MSSQFQKYWSFYCLSGIEIEAQSFDKNNFSTSPNEVPPYFWKDFQERQAKPLTAVKGYSEAKDLIGLGTIANFDNLSSKASAITYQVFSNIVDHNPKPFDPPSEFPSNQRHLTGPSLVKLRLSTDLEQWKNSQKALGNILPHKRSGLTKLSEEMIDILKARDWPEFMLTNAAFFGVGMTNLLAGAADAPTLFSNYLVDMAAYLDHDYESVFPSFESILEKSLSDPHASLTVGGFGRRFAARVGARYLKHKTHLEKRQKANLTYLSARLDRREAQIVYFLECGVLGLAAEAISRGYDPGAAMSDLIFVSSGHDVVDIGSDLVNSEVMNCFMNVADITETGIVSEHVLRRIYDAHAATGARLLTERWHEPTTKIGLVMYTWNIQNERHMFLRRAILGWTKARKTPARPQFEADFDEAFDEKYRTTGFSRPLDPKYQCDGLDTCNQVDEFLKRNDNTTLLRELWWFIVIGPLEYVREGKVDELQEKGLVEGSRLRMVQLFASGQVLEMSWLVAHAHHHAWQVNYLNEAGMFGSLLDSGALIGKLDRFDKTENGNEFADEL